MSRLKIHSFKDRIPGCYYDVVSEIYDKLGEDMFLSIILGSCSDGVIFAKAKDRYYSEYTLGKRLRWIKKNITISKEQTYTGELLDIRNGIPVSWDTAYALINKYFDIKHLRKPTKNRNGKRSGKLRDEFLYLVSGIISAFINRFENVVDRYMSEDQTEEDCEAMFELLGTGITEIDLENLKNGCPMNISSLSPAIEYCFSHAIRPSVSLSKTAYKLNLINDLPSTHPFYDLFHVRPHED